MHKQLRTFRPKSRLALGLTLLLLSVPLVATAGAESPPPPEAAASALQDGPSGQPRARKTPPEPTGPLASPAAMRAGRISCGQVITRSTTLTADVGPCPANGIIIGADNIMLNLNGHTISGTPGSGDGNAAGVRLPNRSGATVTGLPGRSGKKGTVTGFDAGVFINRGSGNTIENLTIRDNISPGGDALLGDGIVLFHSANNRLINNLVAHNGPFDGIGVLGLDSNDNLIQSNTVEDTPATETEFDFVADGSGVGILMNNFLDELGSPRRGESIRNNDVIDNMVRRNDNSGISNITNVGARIVGNTVQDNGRAGERCFEGRGGERTCTPVADPSNGIGFTAGELASRVTSALIQGNTVTGNTGNGIYIQTEENRIVGNTAVNNGGSGGGFNVRVDLHDATTTEVLCEPGSGVECPLPVQSCDQNVWHENRFETAFPECAMGTGPDPALRPAPHPSCSDGIDNDRDGFIDGEDRQCGGEGELPGGGPGPGLDLGSDPGVGGDEPTPIQDEEPTPIQP